MEGVTDGTASPDGVWVLVAVCPDDAGTDSVVLPPVAGVVSVGAPPDGVPPEVELLAVVLLVLLDVSPPPAFGVPLADDEGLSVVAAVPVAAVPGLA